MYRVVGITHPETGEMRRLPIAYASAGSELFLVHRGPDDNIYPFSPYIPQPLGVGRMAKGLLFGVL